MHDKSNVLLVDKREIVQIMGYKKLLNYLKKLKWIKILNTKIQRGNIKILKRENTVKYLFN